MRLMVMFDLPVDTSMERRAYRHFRKALLDEGFLMIQYSIYVRVCVDIKGAHFLEQRISDFSPEVGTIQSIIVTEKQYSEMHFLLGESSQDVRNSAERTIII